MLNQWNNIQQSLLHIILSFSFLGFFICVKMKKTYFRDIRRDCRKNRLKVSFKNVGKYHHCLISNASGTEKPSFWRNCRRNERKGKKLLHDMIMLSVLWFIMAEKITSLWLPSAGSTIHQETNEGDLLEGCIWHEGRLQGTHGKQLVGRSVGGNSFETQGVVRKQKSWGKMLKGAYQECTALRTTEVYSIEVSTGSRGVLFDRISS